MSPKSLKQKLGMLRKVFSPDKFRVILYSGEQDFQIVGVEVLGYDLQEEAEESGRRLPAEKTLRQAQSYLG